jgi:predicted nucleic acid-binding Zn ribbon protein
MDLNNRDYFDFTTEEELPEEHSKDMRNCPHCDKPIPADSLFCLYCGEPVSRGKKNKWVVLIVVFVLIAFLLWIFISLLSTRYF